MTLRRYIVIKADGAEGDEFEVDLPADAPDFTQHPVTKEACRRILSTPSLTIRLWRRRDEAGRFRQASRPSRVSEAGEERRRRLDEGQLSLAANPTKRNTLPVGRV